MRPLPLLRLVILLILGNRLGARAAPCRCSKLQRLAECEFGEMHIEFGEIDSFPGEISMQVMIRDTCGMGRLEKRFRD